MSKTSQYKYLLKGIPASPGIAIGKPHQLRGSNILPPEKNLSEKEIQMEVERFRNAVSLAKRELKELREEAAQKMGEDGAKIFEVHQMLLDDQLLIDETINQIRSEKKNADLIFYHRMKHYQEALEGMENDYFRSRSFDIKDVRQRIIKNMQGEDQKHLNLLQDPRVIVSRELTPSDTVNLERSKILAFVTELGGRTSHAAIMASSLEIPLVVGIDNISAFVKDTYIWVVDGISGEIVIDPSPQLLEHYRKLQKEFYEYEQNLSTIRELPCQTLDGKDIELSANLEFPGDIQSVSAHGARGIGLYRTEYLYLARTQLPSEEEQYQEYTRIAEAIFPNPVIIRAVDLGGDKQSDCIPIPKEANPFLGWRGIRICLDEQILFKAQLRAILRASTRGNVKLIFPLISSVTELDKCINLVNDVKNELKQEGIAFNEKLEIGAMIEVPGTALITDIIASKVDFLSIGTNDLIQFSLAVDRGNERIAELYQPFHPAVLRLIRHIVREGHRKHVWVGMCGEMASDPLAILVLVGLGLDELSVSPVFLPEIKQIIRSVHYGECVQIAEQVMKMSSCDEIKNHMMQIMKHKFGYPRFHQ
ncbi:phosphoenolpyruvate--protein phosphotransferase [candidate division KSB1 bacterium]|nr:phosphoenolpyruvate--protein phosphotransferase [candidate division KSB1 bacterium]